MSNNILQILLFQLKSKKILTNRRQNKRYIPIHTRWIIIKFKNLIVWKELFRSSKGVSLFFFPEEGSHFTWSVSGGFWHAEIRLMCWNMNKEFPGHKGNPSAIIWRKIFCIIIGKTNVHIYIWRDWNVPIAWNHWSCYTRVENYHYYYRYNLTALVQKEEQKQNQWGGSKNFGLSDEYIYIYT